MLIKAGDFNFDRSNQRWKVGFSAEKIRRLLQKTKGREKIKD
jgi:predicted RNA-binding protein with PUA domain